MKDLAYDPDEPIAALATPWGESALAVIRASGRGSIELIAGLFSRPRALQSAASATLHLGTILDAPGGRAIDQVILALYREPTSYTGQDSVELFCHGNPRGVEAILTALAAAGIRAARPGEFTLRAFLNKKMDLTRAEAVQEIVRAKSREAHSLALHRLSGAVEARINDAKERITRLMASVEVQLDYPEDEVPGELASAAAGLPELREELAALAATYRTGRLFQEGVRVALCGKTNAGKSSLFNYLLREERSIVSEHPGTTRDYIESLVTVEGLPILLFDTAGLRSADNAVEIEGIRRSERIIESADLLLYIVDAAAGLSPEDEEFLAAHEGDGGSGDGASGRIIRLWNKVDAAAAPPPRGFLPVSAATGQGLLELIREVRRRAVGEGVALAGEAVIDSARQRRLLDRCVGALDEVMAGIEAGMPADAVALDLKEALDSLGEITGEVTTADILNEMFSGFCVGK